MTNISISPTPPLQIGIIGFGPFAQFLAKTMLKQGHTLTATSRSDHSQLCSQLGIQFFQDIHSFLNSNSSVILISTSILSLSQVLNAIPFQCLKKPTLFVDVLSVKEHPRQLLLEVLPKEMDVLCTHPMFGPVSGKDGWEGLAFMFEKVRIRGGEICSRFLGIFQNEGCRMVEMSCEEHDKQAARSQFLTHTIGRTLSEMDITSTSMDTEGFKTLIDLLKNLENALETLKQKLLVATEKHHRNRSDVYQNAIMELYHFIGSFVNQILEYFSL